MLTIVGLGMLTGRRKFLVEIIVFASAYVTLLLYFGRGAKLALLSGFIGLIGYLAFTLLVPDSPTGGATSRIVSVRDEQYVNYVSRTKSVFDDVPDRFNELGLAPISWAYDDTDYLVLG